MDGDKQALAHDSCIVTARSPLHKPASTIPGSPSSCLISPLHHHPSCVHPSSVPNTIVVALFVHQFSLPRRGFCETITQGLCTYLCRLPVLYFIL